MVFFFFSSLYLWGSYKREVMREQKELGGLCGTVFDEHPGVLLYRDMCLEGWLQLPWRMGHAHSSVVYSICPIIGISGWPALALYQPLDFLAFSNRAVLTSVWECFGFSLFSVICTPKCP